MTDEWAPSTEQVRSHYVFDQSDRWDSERGEAFDRWLAAHDAKVREHARHEFCDRRLGCVVTEGPEWEYGTLRSVTDGWERGDRHGESQYIDARSVSDRLNSDPSTVTGVRDLTKAVRRRKAGPWGPVEQGETDA